MWFILIALYALTIIYSAIMVVGVETLKVRNSDDAEFDVASTLWGFAFCLVPVANVALTTCAFCATFGLETKINAFVTNLVRGTSEEPKKTRGKK